MPLLPQLPARQPGASASAFSLTRRRSDGTSQSRRSWRTRIGAGDRFSVRPPGRSGRCAGDQLGMSTMFEEWSDDARDQRLPSGSLDVFHTTCPSASMSWRGVAGSNRIAPALT